MVAFFLHWLHANELAAFLRLLYNAIEYVRDPVQEQGSRRSLVASAFDDARAASVASADAATSTASRHVRAGESRRR